MMARTSTAGRLHGWGQTLSPLSREETLLPGELVATGALPDDVGEMIHHVLA